MNKSQLVEAVAETLGNRRHAADAVDAVLEAIMRAVAAGERVSIAGFGTFEQVERPARGAGTPRASEHAQVGKAAIPGFQAGQRFKDVISGTERSGGGGGGTGPRKKAATSRSGPAAATKSTARKAASKKAAVQVPAKKAASAKRSSVSPAAGAEAARKR